MNQKSLVSQRVWFSLMHLWAYCTPRPWWRKKHWNNFSTFKGQRKHRFWNIYSMYTWSIYTAVLEWFWLGLGWVSQNIRIWMFYFIQQCTDYFLRHCIPRQPCLLQKMRLCCYIFLSTRSSGVRKILTESDLGTVEPTAAFQDKLATIDWTDHVQGPCLVN